MNPRLIVESMKALFSLLGAGAICYALSTSWGGMAPIGELISPARGIWAHRPTTESEVVALLKSSLSESGLKPVQLDFDPNGVPQLSSQDTTSLYFAQGFVTAYFRLWQMDFLSRIATGRISEIAGERAVPVDRFFRRLQLPRAVKASADLMVLDPVTRGPLLAYSQGVNAWISAARTRPVERLPFEYRLFGLEPETWAPERAASLMKYMTWELTGYLYDLKLNETRNQISAELFDLLFPKLINAPAPILTVAETAIDATAARQNLYATDFNRVRQDTSRAIAMESLPEDLLPDPSNGSNSWALGPAKTRTRLAILANDLHLSYSLPALWLPIQLTGPDQNVFGASLPGAPGVIVGFNEKVGWALTNGMDDVLDWYQLRFRDDRRQEYLFEGSWRPVVAHEETIRVAGRAPEVVKVRETHIGPIVFDSGDRPGIVEIPAGLIPQWTGFMASNELRTFLILNKAETADDCFGAVESYISPPQNFLCADKRGLVDYVHAGLFPDRGSHDGRVVAEAATASDLWQGFLPRKDNPQIRGVKEEIVTANQAPIAGAGATRLGWFFASPYRAMEIHRKLGARKQWTPNELIDVQAGDESGHARWFRALVLRELGPRIDRVGDESGIEHLTARIEKWNGRFTPDSKESVLLTAWWRSFERSLWEELIGSNQTMHWPQQWRLHELIESESRSALWDRQETAAVETLADRLQSALGAALTELKSKTGQSQPMWIDYQETSIRHTARFPGLGRDRIPVGGVAESIFANKGVHGPTWKMIVSFEPGNAGPTSWFMVPGGISGDPGSPDYDRWLKLWAKGEMLPYTMRRKK